MQKDLSRGVIRARALIASSVSSLLDAVVSRRVPDQCLVKVRFLESKLTVYWNVKIDERFFSFQQFKIFEREREKPVLAQV